LLFLRNSIAALLVGYRYTIYTLYMWFVCMLHASCYILHTHTVQADSEREVINIKSLSGR